MKLSLFAVFEWVLKMHLPIAPRQSTHLPSDSSCYREGFAKIKNKLSTPNFPKESHSANKRNLKKDNRISGWHPSSGKKKKEL